MIQIKIFMMILDPQSGAFFWRSGPFLFPITDIPIMFFVHILDPRFYCVQNFFYRKKLILDLNIIKSRIQNVNKTHNGNFSLVPSTNDVSAPEELEYLVSALWRLSNAYLTSGNTHMWTSHKTRVEKQFRNFNTQIFGSDSQSKKVSIDAQSSRSLSTT